VSRIKEKKISTIFSTQSAWFIVCYLGFNPSRLWVREDWGIPARVGKYGFVVERSRETEQGDGADKGLSR
jgi:hypothetical protein